jgi:hypothetical protein
LVLSCLVFSNDGIYAASPSFFRQEIEDSPKDWEIGKLMNKKNFSIETPDGELVVERAETNGECMRQGEFPSPDIQGVSYFSDGKGLNATIWLSTTFKEHFLDESLNSTESYSKLPWHQMGYTLSIDTLSVYDTGATDYFAEIKWDFIDQTWDFIVFEGSKTGEKREIYVENNYTDFFENGKRYFTFSLDLNKINQPETYKVIFAAYDNYLSNNKFCYVYDTTNWVHIPPPEFKLSTTPTSTSLRPGETRNIELQVQSMTNLKSNIELYNNNVNDLEVSFEPNYLFVPPNGISTTHLKIKALENSDIGPLTVPIYAKIFFVTEGELRGGQDFKGDPTIGNITEDVNLAIEILRPLTPQEHLNTFFTEWFTPLTAMYQTISGIIGITIGWIYGKRRK